MQSVLESLITWNEQIGKKTELFSKLLIEHDAALDQLLEQVGKTVPEIRKELDAKLTAAVPELVQEAHGKYNEEIEARYSAALVESQTKLEAIRAEVVALAQAQFSEAEKQIGLTAEQIEARILGTLTEAAKERITKLERGLVIEIQHAVNAALPKTELAAAPTLIDSYRGQWKEGMVAQRGDLFSWYGSTYLALEDTNDTPGRKNIATAGAKWAVIAARGAGGGGGGGGDSLPSQSGNAGKFLKTDGTTTLWETIPGGGDMLGANNLTDVASVTAAFANIKQAATTTASGVVTFATSGESAALKAVQANDARLSDSRTPTAHASTHETGGSDPIDFPVDSVFGATNTITQVDYFALNTSSTASVTTAKAVWNSTEGAIEIGLDSNVNALLGVDQHIKIYNQSGSAFTKGQVVKQDGSSGTRLKVDLALATDDLNSATTIGLVAESISDNSSGFIITSGLIRNINTNAFDEGDTLWLSATTAGGLTNVRPTQPNHSVRIGYCIKKSGGAGMIYVDILNGFELEELHDVLVTSVANRDFLSWDSSTTVWRNRQLFDSTAPAALGASATAGVSITAARIDHVHARPTLDQLDISGAAQGDILYRSATSWARLPAATAGYILQTNGAAANPGWVQNTGGSGAPTDAEYLVASANGTLSAERVIQNSTSITVNLATGGQFALERAALTGDVTASQNSNSTTIANGVVSTAKLGGDITTAGKALLDDADAAAQRTTLGLGTLATQNGTFSGTSSGTNTGDQTISLTGDVTGSGTGSFAATIANGAVSTAKLGGDITTAGKALLDDADAAAQRTTLGLGTLATQSGTFSGTSSGTNTGDQTIALTGDVTGSGTGSFAATIASGAVSTSKLGGDITTAGKALLDDADAAAQRTTLGLGTLATQSGTFSGTSSGTNTGDQTITLTGDVTGSGTGSFAATIANDAVSYAKIQNVSGTDKVLGRSSAGAGDIEEITCTAAGRALIDDADAAAQRTTLGLGTLATQSGTFSGTSSGTNTGDQTITLTGDVTGSGTGSFAATIAAGAVSTSKLGGDITTAGKALLDDADAAAQRTTLSLNNVTNHAQTQAAIVPNTTPSSGQVLVGNAGGTAYAPASMSGDATLASTGALTIANDAVSNAKLANMTASTIKARITGSTGDPEDATLTQVLDLVGSATYGDILYRDSSSWARLPAGTSGNYLKTQGAGAAPTWAAVSASGGGTKTYAFFTPLQNQPPATTFATLDTRNSVAVLDFDDGASNESSIFVGVMPEAAALGSGLKVRVHWMATSATSGLCRWGAQLADLSDQDVDSYAFDTAVEVSTTADATSGKIAVTEVSITTIDSITAGVPYALKLYRDSSDTTNDTMIGDAELVAVEVRSAT